jgi:hypothetical protein
MATNRPPFAPSLVFRPSCAGALAALFCCLVLMACRGQGTNNTDGSSALVASDSQAAADRLSKLTEGQNIEVPAAAIAKSCSGESLCVVQLSDGPEQYIASVVVGLNAETFAALKADLADMKQEQSVLSLSGRSTKPNYIYCRPPTLTLPIPDLSRVLKYFTCELSNYPAMYRASRRNKQGSELRDMREPFPGRLIMNTRRLKCEDQPWLDCKSGKKIYYGSLLGD